jgi:hypothetical protein
MVGPFDIFQGLQNGRMIMDDNLLDNTKLPCRKSLLVDINDETLANFIKQKHQAKGGGERRKEERERERTQV